MHEVLRQDIESGAIKVICLIQIQILGEDIQHICAALSDIIRQDFNSVAAHHRQQCIVPLLKVRLAKLGLYGSKFALQDGNKKISASARRLQETRINALCFTLDQVEHIFDQPLRCEHLTVVCNAFFGLDQIHNDVFLSRPAACGGRRRSPDTPHWAYTSLGYSLELLEKFEQFWQIYGFTHLFKSGCA